MLNIYEPFELGGKINSAEIPFAIGENKRSY